MAINRTAMESQTLTTAQTADRLGIQPATLRQLRRRGQINGIERGPRWWEYEVREIERYEKERQEKGRPRKAAG